MKKSSKKSTKQKTPTEFPHQQVLNELKDKFTYVGNCTELEDEDSLVSEVFSNATEMSNVTGFNGTDASVSDNEDVILISKDQFLNLVAPCNKKANHIKKASSWAINLKERVAWAYREDEDIHYFYT